MDTKKKIEEGVQYLLTYPEVRASALMESDIRLVLNVIATHAKKEAYKNGLEAGKKILQEDMKDILVAFNAKWSQLPIEEKMKDAEFILERNEFPERKLTTFYLWRK